MRTRYKGYGNKNVVGKTIESLRIANGMQQNEFIAKLQIAGLDIDDATYSKLEGQNRKACDKDIYIIAKVLKVPMEKLFENSDL